jgi:hypothetical protein
LCCQHGYSALPRLLASSTSLHYQIRPDQASLVFRGDTGVDTAEGDK